MCFILYLATTTKVRRQASDVKNRHLCVEDIHCVEEDIRSHFSLPEIAYVGSSLGCGCGFRSVSFQNGDWPEEWMIAHGECEAPDAHIQDHQELFDLVSTLLADGYPAELYGCWDGEEKDETVHRELILPNRLLDTGFWFRSRGLYQIAKSEQAVSAADDKLPS